MQAKMKMQVILLEKVNKLGNLGDIVKVAKGYARNFLLPQKKARRATDEAIQEFETRRAELEKAAAEKLLAAQQIGEKLAGSTVQISQKSGVDGRLFGSVTNNDIANVLKAQGFDIEKSSATLARRTAQNGRRSYGAGFTSYGCSGDGYCIGPWRARLNGKPIRAVALR